MEMPIKILTESTKIHKSIESMVFDGENMKVCIGGSEGSVSVWNLEENENSVEEETSFMCVKKNEECHDGFVTCMSQTDNFFATGSQDGTIKVFDKVRLMMFEIHIVINVILKFYCKHQHIHFNYFVKLKDDWH